MRAAFYTLGCKVNSYETEKLQKMFAVDGAEIVPFEEQADVYIVNTCTVTQIAAKKSRQILHRARRISPDALIIAAGCYADESPGALPDDIVDLYIGNADKMRIPEIVKEHFREHPIPVQTINAQTAEAIQDRTRAVLKIQDGCRQFCTYCIIPFVRGPLQSRPVQECVEETERLVRDGYHEIVLTGIHVSSYGKKGTYPDPEESGSLGDLILRLSEIPGDFRIRLSSLEPGIVTRGFVSRISQTDKLCMHFHLSLQSGSAKVLREMNRHYTPEEYLQAMDMLRGVDPDTGFTTDLIVGFPGETEQEFQESLGFIEKAAFNRVHVFKYSRRPGTGAAKRKDQIPEEIKHERSRLAIAKAGEVAERNAARYIGSVREVLLETGDALQMEGYTREYLRTVVTDPRGGLCPNKLVKVRLNGIDHNRTTAGEEICFTGGVEIG